MMSHDEAARPLECRSVMPSGSSERDIEASELRVLHIQRSSGIGGSERHLLALLPALSARGFVPHMLILARPGAEVFSRAMEEVGVTTSSIEMAAHLELSLVARLRQEIRTHASHIVHTHLMHADLHGQMAAGFARVPSVSSVHGTPANYHRPAGWAAASVAGRLADRTIAISDHVARFLRRRRLVPEERIRVVPYGLDPAMWQAPGAAQNVRARVATAPEDVVVLVASRLIPYKGHAFLLEAFERAASQCPQLRLVIAGEGPLMAQLRARVANMESRDRVAFLGFVESLPAVMAASDIVAFPTMPGFGEGFGLVNLEAMAAGKPVIGTNIDSIPEIVVDGGTGRLVTPGDVAALAAALTEIGSSEDLRRRLGTAGARRARDRFGLDQMVSRTIDVYRDVLGGDRVEV